MDRTLALALALAMATHAGFILSAHAPKHRAVVPDEPPAIVEVSEPTDDPNEAKVEEGTTLVAAQPAAPRPNSFGIQPAKPSGRGHEIVTAPSGTTTAESAPSPSPSSTEGAAKVASANSPGSKTFPGLVDLGSPGKHVFILPKSEVPAKSDAVASKLDKTLKSSLDDRDHEIGAGPGGPVVSAAHSAALGSKAPETGRATYEVETDNVGSIIAVRLVESSADTPGWELVGSTLRATLGAQKLRVPAGAKGVLVKVLVEAMMKLPSGATQKLSVGPSGLGVGGKFDLSDIGAKPARVVAVRVLDERRL
jgi:hypothetical protein